MSVVKIVTGCHIDPSSVDALAMAYRDLHLNNWRDYAARYLDRCLLVEYGDDLSWILVGRNPWWLKVCLLSLRANRLASRWLLWVDTDTLVLNHTISLSQYQCLDRRYDVILNEGAMGDGSRAVECGIILLRNSPWSHQFLREWWARGDWGHSLWTENTPPSLGSDNCVLDRWLEKDSELHAHFKSQPSLSGLKPFL